MFAFPFTAVSVGTIFDNFEIVLSGDRIDLFHISYRTENMHRNNRFGLRSDRRFKFRRIHTEGIRFNIHNHRSCPAVDHRFTGGKPGQCRNDDLIAFTDTICLKSHFKRNSSVCHHHTVAGSGIFC